MNTVQTNYMAMYNMQNVHVYINENHIIQISSGIARGRVLNGGAFIQMQINELLESMCTSTKSN